MFVRTKYGVYEEKETVGGLKYFEIQTVGNCYYNLCRNDKLWNDFVIKQADTIEELCDEFVLYDNQLNTYGVFVKKVIGYKWLQNHLEIYKSMTIYGAIWTDKGLIYVAKMNEKGELELI